MTEQELQECAANPTCECVIAAALSFARSIDDAPERVVALCRIASAQTKAGDKQAARNTCAFALSAARSIASANFRVSALCGIALAQAEAGDAQSARDTFTVALSTARRINNVTDDRGLCTIASAQAEAGDINGAFATARSIDNAASHAWALCDIALAQAKAGDKQAVRDTCASVLSSTRRIYTAEMRADVLCRVALAQAEAGDKQAARATCASVLSFAQSTDNAHDRASALCHIALAQAKAGDKQAARATCASALSSARSIDNADVDLIDIASAQAKAGDINGAFATVRSIGKALYRVYALSNIASAQAEAGDAQSARSACACALSAAQSIDDAHGCRASALCNIASAQAKAGDFRGAMKTAMEIQWEDDRAVALVGIAECLVARPSPEPKRKIPPPKRARVAADGPADPEIIRKVEKAAVAYVRKILRAKGWRVVSVETMKRGYDLHCTKPDGEMHVEVKGTRGDEPSFMLTRGEHERAQSDPKFALFLVLRALDAPRLVVFSGGKLLRKFDFQTVQYKATEK